MANETLVIEQLINNFSSTMRFLQAIGLVALLYLIMGIIDFIYKKKQGRALKRIEEDLLEIKHKLNKK